MIRKSLVILVFLLQGFYLFATAQVPDILIYNGETYELTVNPMEAYFNRFPEKRPPFTITSLWRGYVATFEIIQNELWVIDIKKYESERIDGKYITRYVSIINECLDGQERMKIDWFNGVLVLPQGRIVNYVHMGYASTYEHYTILEIQNGIFRRELNMNNRQYVEFRERQFEHYRQTEAYRQLIERIKGIDDLEEEIEKFLKIYIIEYLEMIYE
jgi:hypothetical protein